MNKMFCAIAIILIIITTQTIIVANLPTPVTSGVNCSPTGTWSTWSSTTTCVLVCGACGMQTQTRTCESQSAGCPCSGVSSQTANVSEPACLAPYNCNQPTPDCCPYYLPECCTGYGCDQ